MAATSRILSDYFFQSDSLIDASAPFGLPGTVSVSAPQVDLSGSLVGLPSNLLDVETQLRPDCGVRLAANLSSFIVLGRGGLPHGAGRFRAERDGATPDEAEMERLASVRVRTGALVRATGSRLLRRLVGAQVLPPPPVQAGHRQQIADEARLFVRGFQFEGNRAFSGAELAKVTEPFTNRELSSEDIEQARRAVSLYYVSHGYINSGAIIPDQDPTNGIVRIRIVEGELSGIDVARQQMASRQLYHQSAGALGRPAAQPEQIAGRPAVAPAES